MNRVNNVRSRLGPLFIDLDGIDLSAPQISIVADRDSDAWTESVSTVLKCRQRWPRTSAIAFANRARWKSASTPVPSPHRGHCPSGANAESRPGGPGQGKAGSLSGLRPAPTAEQEPKLPDQIADAWAVVLSGNAKDE